MTDLDIRFDYHAPDERKRDMHEQTRRSMRRVAEYADSCLPEGREKEIALTKIEEAMFWANASIARNH